MFGKLTFSNCEFAERENWHFHKSYTLGTHIAQHLSQTSAAQQSVTKLTVAETEIWSHFYALLKPTLFGKPAYA